MNKNSKIFVAGHKGLVEAILRILRTKVIPIFFTLINQT